LIVLDVDREISVPGRPAHLPARDTADAPEQARSRYLEAAVLNQISRGRRRTGYRELSRERSAQERRTVKEASHMISSNRAGVTPPVEDINRYARRLKFIA